MTPIKPGPFQIGSREDRARRPCRSPAVLQGLTGNVIPSRKPRHLTAAKYVPFAVRVGVLDQKPSLIVGLSKPPANRRLVWSCELLWALRFSFLLPSTLTFGHSSRRTEAAGNLPMACVPYIVVV